MKARFFEPNLVMKSKFIIPYLILHASLCFSFYLWLGEGIVKSVNCCILLGASPRCIKVNSWAWRLSASTLINLVGKSFRITIEFAWVSENYFFFVPVDGIFSVSLVILGAERAEVDSVNVSVWLRVWKSGEFHWWLRWGNLFFFPGNYYFPV